MWPADRGTGGTFALGTGWIWPAAVVSLFIAVIYLPSHHSSGGGGEGLVAAIAAVYVVGLSVVLPRLVRGGILRLAGARDPIVLLGRASEASTGSGAVRARWRIGAIAAAGGVSAIGVLGGVALSGIAEPSTYAHAIAALFLGTNAIVVAGMLVPIPGFTGWALLLAFIDAAGTPADLRVRRAARLVQAIGFPIFLLVGLAAAFIGDPMLMLVGFLLAMLSWTQIDLAVGRDAIDRFLAGRLAGDVARPIRVHAEADDLADDLDGKPVNPRAVIAVETSGALVGAIGPRQLAERDRARSGDRCSDVMVPIGSVPLLPADTPATSILSVLGRRGFVLVRMPGGLAYVEAADLLDRILGGDPGREPGGVSP